MRKIRVGIIGGGISGLSCAWLLSNKCEITLFEKNNYIGGHSNTVDIVPMNERESISVDTGFIVFNSKNYPNLVELLKKLDVKTYNSDMSFSVSLKKLQLEYGGNNIHSFFAQKKNCFNLKFWVMTKDIIRFFLFAKKDSNEHLNISIDTYLKNKNYSEYFKNFFIYPMASSIWSTSFEDIKDYPFIKFIEFFENHGLLNFFKRPQWKTIHGGSKKYVEKIIKKKNIQVLRNEEVLSFKNKENSIIVKTSKGTQNFDHLVFANHSDEVYKILSVSNKKEKKFFKMIKFQKNLAYLHSDTKLMPSLKKVWSSWNYLQDDEKTKDVTLSYWMNNLQNLKTNTPIIVTLNPKRKPKKNLIYNKFKYSHPVFNFKTIKAQKEILKLNSEKNNIWFCGAYLGNGFHEDGLNSGLKVAEKILNIRRPWQK